MNSRILPTGEAIGVLPVAGLDVDPITVIGTEAIRRSFDPLCLKQAITSRLAPGVSKLVLNPDAHAGYGAPVGCVLASPTHIYPGPVGVDMKCSMSLLQTDLPEHELKSKQSRRAVIDALLERLPTGPGKGQRSVKKSRHVDYATGQKVASEGASSNICRELGVPESWTGACEDPVHRGVDGTADALLERFRFHEKLRGEDFLYSKIQQLGSYGGGNHFGEANVVHIQAGEQDVARAFGLSEGNVAFLSHCGSRGFGYYLAQYQFKSLQEKFAVSQTPFPGGDRELVYAEAGSEEASAYLNDLALGGNFATLNHLLINSLVLEAFQQVFPGLKGELVYFISHNIVRRELLHGLEQWVHRKGATRACPAGHASLSGTRYAATGHPILLPGNPAAGSVVMVAEPGAEISGFSVNHGAGRAMSRTAAKKQLSQSQVDSDLERCDVLSNCRQYPLDEAPQSYKDFREVLASVEKAKLARTVARLTARFVIKDGDSSNGGAA